MTLATEAYASVERFHTVGEQWVGSSGTVMPHECVHACSVGSGKCSHPVCQALPTLVLSNTLAIAIQLSLQVPSTGCTLRAHVTTV